MGATARPSAYVLDAGAMVAFLCDEQGAEVVAQVLAEGAVPCFAHVVNVYEVYYDALRRGGEAAAVQLLEMLVSAGIGSRSDLDPALWQDAAFLKAFHHPVAVADTFCLALARRLRATVLTTDHHEFDRLVPLNLCPIEFIR